MPPIAKVGIGYEAECYNSDTDSYENCDRCVEDSDCCSGYCYDRRGDGVKVCTTWYVEVVKTNSTESIMINFDLRIENIPALALGSLCQNTFHVHIFAIISIISSLAKCRLLPLVHPLFFNVALVQTTQVKGEDVIGESSTQFLLITLAFYVCILI